MTVDIEQLKESIKPGKMTVDIERELKLYSPKKNPLESVRLPPLAAIGPAVMGRLPDEGYADCTEWLSSPVPGFRTQPKLDPTRTIACSEKNSLIYRQLWSYSKVRWLRSWRTLSIWPNI